MSAAQGAHTLLTTEHDDHTLSLVGIVILPYRTSLFDVTVSPLSSLQSLHACPPRH